jgi:1,4-alpha-glucan branching enzyme
MHNHGMRYKTVELCGSFDNWKVRHSMSFDSFTNQWFITLHLAKDKYTYKYVINEGAWVVNDKEPNEKDTAGNVNNFLIL